MSSFKLELTPERHGIPAGFPAELHVLARLSGPAIKPDGKDRNPMNLSLVIDRSASMNGKPLQEAKRCAAHIFNNLSADDYVSLVVYDDTVDVLVPTRQVGDRQQILQKLEGIHSGGMTALYDGWYQGRQMAEMGLDRATINRVLLLSDGGANQGLTNTGKIQKYCQNAASQGITTSTYGLGRSFNEELMVSMAKAGGGNSYYGESADDLMEPFTEEFDLLSGQSGRSIVLNLDAPDGTHIEVLNNYNAVGENSWAMPDLAYGGECWALIRLRFDKLPSPDSADNLSTILKANIRLVETESESSVDEYDEIRLPVVDSGDFANLELEEMVSSRLKEIRFARLQEQARTAANKQDWAQVDRLLAIAEQEAAGNAWLNESLKGLRDYAKRKESVMFSKEAIYTSSRIRSRLVDPNEKTGEYDVDSESRKSSFLRRKFAQGRRMK